jgi:DNA-binding IclR family transcriptional regulator
MADSAPAIDRAFKVLTFLAEHPDEAFTLSELSRRLGYSKATCHAMFASLMNAGVLLRNPGDGRYSLGPALIALGAAVAPESERAIEYARRQMATLTQELGVACVASIRVGDEVIVAARLLSLAPHGAGGRIPTAVGTRAYWMPPVGPLFAAWASTEVAERWCERAGTPEDRQHYRALLERVRSVGYDVSYVFDVRARLLEEVAVARMGHPDDVRRLVRDIVDRTTPAPLATEEGAADMVRTIQAPVFGRSGDVVMMLALSSLPQPMSARAIERYATRLHAATDEITQAIHGQFPTGWVTLDAGATG